MSCFCCENPYNLGCVPACDGQEIVTPIRAPLSGTNTYTMKLDFNGIEVVLTTSAVKDTLIAFAFDSNCMNESYTYKAQVYDKNGTLLEYTNIDGTFDCFKFQTVIQQIC